MWLVWVASDKTECVGVTANEEHAALLVRALNVYDTEVGGEFSAYYTPMNDLHDHRYDIERSA